MVLSFFKFMNAPNIASLRVDLDSIMYIPFTHVVANPTLLPRLESLTMAVMHDIVALPDEDVKSILQIVEGRSHPKLKKLRIMPYLMQGHHDDKQKIEELVESFEYMEAVGSVDGTIYF